MVSGQDSNLRVKPVLGPGLGKLGKPALVLGFGPVFQTTSIAPSRVAALFICYHTDASFFRRFLRPEKCLPFCFVEGALHDRESWRAPSADAQVQHRGDGRSETERGGPDPVDRAVQVLLAAIIERPHQEVLPLVQDLYPGQPVSFYSSVMKAVRRSIEELTMGGHKPSGDILSLPLVDRLSFCWRFLRQADVLVWKLKKGEVPEHTEVHHAAAAFRNILPFPLQQPLLASLLSRLRLGPDARYLFHYWRFRRAKSPSKLPAPFGDLIQTRDRDLLRTVIWWCLRARREEYVEVRLNEPVRIEFSFVVEQVLQDLRGWCGPEIDQVRDVGGEIERELNLWLSYSRLEFTHEDMQLDAILDPEIAKAFVKHNELTTKLHIHRAELDAPSDDRIMQLETTIRQYADENRALEERIRVHEASTLHPKALSEPGPEAGTLTELRDLLRTIDTKYAFDTLNAVNSGEDTHLTLRSFVSHLFYALRKRGFSEYPNEEQFYLSYEQSGLYDCDGFQIPPYGSALVKVARKGWALNSRGRWLPVRRARVVEVAQAGNNEAAT